MKIIRNCLGTQSRDPAVTKYHGKYYWIYASESRLYIIAADKIDDFASAEPTLVWTPDRNEYAHEVWAPELHVVDGKCYIYVACDDGDNYHHRMYVLSNGCDNPLATYDMIGKITDSTDKWAIDGTLLHHKTGMYIIWSGWEGDKNIEQNIYIAKLKSPTEIDGERVMISRPDHEWEKLGGDGIDGGLPFINEGPFAFSESGRTFVAYSGAGSWCTDYCIALIELVGDDPMDPSSWKKQDSPVLSKNESFKGTGHCSIVEEDKLIFFHAWPVGEENIVWNTVYPVCATYRIDGDKLIIE